MLLMTLIAATLGVAQPAPALDARATLSAPGEGRSAVFDGRNWTCGPDGACVARGAGASQPVLRECRRFVARFGVVTRYERDGAALTEAQLAQCNTAAPAR
ncbi:CC_3452 family protein [Brevundimonas sp.]|uniref:CC_3452 family protein n=1 Tax=Brevundimonas sp. TaxID=1871086 RepID=UPI002BB87A6B|nr:hypothetical protein [Brevundimonas sp.]HWQ85801.1 hypothetical protein [Brevundimonas sp.]